MNALLPAPLNPPQSVPKAEGLSGPLGPATCRSSELPLRVCCPSTPSRCGTWEIFRKVSPRSWILLREKILEPPSPLPTHKPLQTPGFLSQSSDPFFPGRVPTASLQSLKSALAPNPASNDLSHMDLLLPTPHLHGLPCVSSPLKNQSPPQGPRARGLKHQVSYLSCFPKVYAAPFLPIIPLPLTIMLFTQSSLLWTLVELRVFLLPCTVQGTPPHTHPMPY